LRERKDEAVHGWVLDSEFLLPRQQSVSALASLGLVEPAGGRTARGTVGPRRSLARDDDLEGVGARQAARVMERLVRAYDGLWRCPAVQPEDAVEWRKSGTRLRHIR
jgi:hypothetical protein